MRLTIATALVMAAATQAAELKPATVAAFDGYVAAAEARMEAELRSGKFLRIADWPEGRREAGLARLRSGEVVVERMAAPGSGKADKVPDGLIHHWLGTVFIPGVTLEQTLAAVQDYDNHHSAYAPEVVASRLLRRKGDDFRIFLRLRKKKVVTVVLDTEYDVHYTHLDSARAYSRSYSRRIAEVADAGEPGEHQLPEGKDHGFLWRLYTYWRFREGAEGVYVECEAISLTRDVPTGLGWLIRPFIENVPRESLTFTLQATRNALLGKTTVSPDARNAARMKGDKK
jgi:hypothetical protein